MQDMIVKSVDVLGDAIMATKDSEGNIWAGVSYFCKALGMNNVQKDTQVDKIKTDKTLNKGYRKFPVGVFDQSNETIAIRLDFIPIWLAKISITKRMEQDHPELADKLLKYQLQAKDILAAAFLPKQPHLPQNPIELLELHYKAIKQVDGKAEKALTGIEELKEQFNTFEKSLPLLPNEADEVSNAVKKRVLEILGGKESQAYKNRGICQKAFKDAYSQLKRNFGDIKRYKDIKREQKEQAVAIAGRYEPPLYLRELIEQENAQQRFEI